MAVDWTPHRFSGGALALDVANTVVLRNRPERQFDRFEDASEIARFAEAASRERRSELGGRRIHVADGAEAKPVVVAIREATDSLFREAALNEALRLELLAPFLKAVAEGIRRDAFSPLEGAVSAGQRGSVKAARRLRGADLSAARSGLPAISPSNGESPKPSAGQSLCLEAALGLSALSLLPPDMHRRIRICRNCAWLFLDRSRNRSRIWCDMAVCGNREKARRHTLTRGRKERIDA